MIKIDIYSSHAYLSGIGVKRAATINDACSYPVDGAWFTPSYQEGNWDGKRRLMKLTKRGYKVPSGLVTSVVSVIDAHEWPREIVDHRDGAFACSYGWKTDMVLRPYQQRAVDAVLGQEVVPLRSILRLPIRSGKTFVAAAIIREVGQRAIFICNTGQIFSQTVKLFEKCFGKEVVGQVGGDTYDPRQVTVATIQKLASLPSKTLNKLLGGFGLSILDEVHHYAKGEKWRDTILGCDIPFRIGISATVWLDKSKANRSENIWLRGVCGPIVYTTTTSALIKAGYLAKPHIFMVKSKPPKGMLLSLLEKAKYQTVYKVGIAENRLRNRIIADIIKLVAPYGLSTFVICTRKAQMKQINDLCEVPSMPIHGGTPQSKREAIFADLESGRIKAAIGTVIGEGVDVPFVNVVINAEGGKDEVSTIQRMRNLTPEGADKLAIFIDFYDEFEPRLEGHSNARMAVYSSEQEFVTHGIVEINEILDLFS